MTIGLSEFEAEQAADRYLNSVRSLGLTHDAQDAIKKAIGAAIANNNQRLEADIKKMLDEIGRKLASR